MFYKEFIRDFRLVREAIDHGLISQDVAVKSIREDFEQAMKEAGF